jgi:hypothetical protein
MSVNDDIISAAARCNGIYNVIPSFWHIYSFNTENIREYIDHFDLKDKSLLTVGSSGEQVINARIRGAKDITLYDACPFAKYYTWLKIAAILSFDYDHFKRFFFVYTGSASGHGRNVYRFNERYFNILAPLLKELDYESYYFWSELYKKVKKDSNISTIFKDEETRFKVISGYSLYLNSEEDYNKAKKALRDITFKFVHGNLFWDKVEGHFDNIWLSNMCTYYTVYEIMALIKKLEDNLNIDGRMLFAYLYEVDFNFDDDSENNLMYRMDFVKDYFKDYLTEHYNVRTAKEIQWNDKRDKEDLVLIYHK